jgi:hypothetical protein
MMYFSGRLDAGMHPAQPVLDIVPERGNRFLHLVEMQVDRAAGADEAKAVFRSRENRFPYWGVLGLLPLEFLGSLRQRSASLPDLVPFQSSPSDRNDTAARQRSLALERNLASERHYFLARFFPFRLDALAFFFVLIEPRIEAALVSDRIRPGIADYFIPDRSLASVCLSSS